MKIEKDAVEILSGRPSRPHPRQPGVLHHPQPRPRELERRHVARPAARRGTPARGACATPSRTRGPRRGAQVRHRRPAQRPRAGERAGDHVPGRGRGPRPRPAPPGGDRGPLPRAPDRRGRLPRGAPSTWEALDASRGLPVRCVDPEVERGDDGRDRPRQEGRGQRRRRVSRSWSRGAPGPRLVHALGPTPRRSTGPGAHVDSRGQGVSRSERASTPGPCGGPRSTTRSCGPTTRASSARRTAPGESRGECPTAR